MEETKKPQPKKSGCGCLIFIVLFIIAVIFVSSLFKPTVYVSKASPEVKEQFKEYAKNIVDKSDGVILSLTESSQDGWFQMQVSNEWHLMKDTEKLYFASEMLKAITETSATMYGAKENVIFTVYDENDKTVADINMTGGMQLKN